MSSGLRQLLSRRERHGSGTVPSELVGVHCGAAQPPLDAGLDSLQRDVGAARFSTCFSTWFFSVSFGVLFEDDAASRQFEAQFEVIASRAFRLGI